MVVGFTAGLLLTVLSVYGQEAPCDSAFLYELRDLQIKTADHVFSNVYSLKRETFPFDYSIADGGEKVNAYKPVCPDMYYWNGTPLKSAQAKMAKAADPKLFVYCTISIPVVNAKRNRCCIQMLSFFGNWGSKGETYFYKKRFGKWKLRKSKVIFTG
jgi:hypothetical protein